MRRSISFILILVIIGETFLFALNTQAAVKSSAVTFSGCVTGNIAGTYLSDKIAGIVGKLGSRYSILTTVPVDDAAAHNQFMTKAYVTDVIARCAARTILTTMVGNIFNIMRTNGRDGGLTFIKNWSNFQTQAQYRGENIFRAELSTAKLCNYLADDIKKAFGVDPKKQTVLGDKQNTRTNSLQTFDLATKCTMPAGFTPQKYQQDFAGNGGWDTFSRMLEPQNNAWGLVALSQDEITKQRALSVSADTNQALAGLGYIGTSGRGGGVGSCAVKSPNGADCIVYNDIKTTGSYIAANVAAGINAELTWITSAQSLGSIVANLTEVLFNRLLDQGEPDEGSPLVADETGGIDLDGIAPPGGTCSAPLPVPPGSPPNMFSVVQQVASEFPEDLTNSCANMDFLDKVVARLHAQDSNWGYNGKRGNTSDLSKDAISYLAGGTTSVFIIDIIGGHCGDNPQPAWQDVTAETYQCGVTGAYVYPRGSGGGGGGINPPPEPAI